MEAKVADLPGYVAGKWKIDPVHSDIGFVVRHMMVSKVRGHFTKFEGEIVTAENPLESSATLSVDLTSIDTSNDMRDNHIRSADFFSVEEHPTMTYETTGVRQDADQFIVEGDLTIRGVTRSVPLTVEVNGFGPDAYGGTRCGFSATGEINRHDFGVSYNGPIPGGGTVISDRVQLVLEVEAVLEA